jgi:glycogen(starch) synthase
LNICFFALEHHAIGSAGGIASYLDGLTGELAKLGHGIHIIVKGKRDKSIELEKRVFLHEFKGGSVHWYLSKLPLVGKIIALPVRELEWSFEFWQKLRDLKKIYCFDLIESSETGNLMTGLFEKSIPIVIRLHGSAYSFEKATTGKPSLGARLDRALQRVSFKRARGISAPSDFQKRIFKAEVGEGFRVPIIPNPLKYGPTTCKHEVTDDGRKVIFFAGRIAEVKGAWTLLKAFARIVSDIPEARLILAGSPHVSMSAGAVQIFLKENRILDKVEFVGHVQREEIGRYYENCAVYAAPSFYETFCISAIEAMLHGKPVVGSSGTALEEIIDDGETGLLVSPGDEIALARALLKLLNNKELAGEMGEAGKRKAAQYQLDAAVRKALKFYEDLIGGKAESGT